jgi:hypothetical protein
MGEVVAGMGAVGGLRAVRVEEDLMSYSFASAEGDCVEFGLVGGIEDGFSHCVVLLS